MEKITYELLNAIVEELKDARNYVVENFNELKARPYSYMLYGTTTVGLGPMIPDKYLIPKRERQLCKRTRKTDYTAYFLDENYHVLQTREVSNRNYCNLTMSLHFEMNGVHYSHGFIEFEDQKYHRRTCFMKYTDNTPVLYADLDGSLLYVQCYAYDTPGMMKVTAIRYFMNAKRTVYGLPVCWDAPIGAPNSPVQVQQWAEDPQDTDLSKWFK